MEQNCIFKGYSKVLCIETNTSLGSLLLLEGRELQENSRSTGLPAPAILSPDVISNFEAKLVDF